MSIIQLLYLFALAVYTILATYILADKHTKALNRSCAYFIVALAVWAMGRLLMLSPGTSYEGAQWALNISSLGWIFFASAFLHFILIFTGREAVLVKRWIFAAIYGIPLVIMGLQWSGRVANIYPQRQWYGWAYGFSPSLWQYSYHLYYLVFMAFSLRLLVKCYLECAEDNRKRQALIIFSATSISLVSGTIFDVMLPQARYFSVPPLAPVILLLWAGGLVYAIARYKFFSLTPATAAESIFAAASDCFILTDKDAKIKAVNDAAYSMLGYRRQELEGRPLSILFKYAGFYRNTIIHEKMTQNSDVTLLAKDGHEVSVMYSCSILRDDLGRNIGMAYVAKDISHRKHTERKLLEEKILTDTIINALPGIFYLFDDQGKFNRWNKNFEAVSGYSAAQISSMGPVDFIAAEDQDRVAAAIAELFTKGIVSVEANLRSKDGRSIPHFFTGVQLVLGEKKYLLGVGLDISQRKLAEEAIARAAQEWSATFDSMSDGISIHSEDFEIINANQALCDVLGKTKQELIGRRCYEVMHRSSEHHQLCPLEKAKHSLLKEYAEIYEPQLDKWLAVSVSPFMDKDKNLRRFIHSVRDITVHKRDEEELKQAYEKLKEAQKQLVQTEKMAAVGQLASGVAHEINNPLTGVLNNVQLVKMQAQAPRPFSPDELSQLFDAIEQSALRCKRIVQSLLDFSRSSGGGFEPVSLNTLVNKVVALIQNEMKLGNIVFAPELAAELPLIKGDLQLLQQVIFNLITNAKWAIDKKSPGAGGTITLRTFSDAQAQRVWLWISDPGIGIDEQNLKRIFEPFYTTKAVGEGTGLGLSLVYRIIQDHQGTIDAESRPNEGSTFKISFPVISAG